uniref:Uncharacterized protein n=1 Tax=Oryza meridionalis TaxID=40149 RepID=A0A0E0CMG4_9ORYZ
MQDQAAPVPWSTDLFDCFDDSSNCFMTWLCPCITFGQIAEIVDRGSSSCGTSGSLYALVFLGTGCSCIYSCFYRSKLRSQYGLQETPCPDCLVHLWMAREHGEAGAQAGDDHAAAHVPRDDTLIDRVISGFSAKDGQGRAACYVPTYERDFSCGFVKDNSKGL